MLEGVVIENGTIITPGNELNNKDGKLTRVVIDENGKISHVGLEKPDEGYYDGYRKIDATGKIVAPGFMDSHVHITTDFENIDSQELFDIIQTKSLDFLKQGVTSYMLGTMAMSDIKLEETLDVIRRLKGIDNGPELLGALVEGTFINRDIAGAMDPKYISPKSRFYFDGLINEYSDIIKKIVFAPEVNSEYFDFINRVNNTKGMVSSLGHSLATSTQAKNILDNVRVLNHFFNRDSPLHHRDPGIVGAVLDYDFDRDLFLELISDGVHVSPDAIKLLINIIENKGGNLEDRIMLITDAINIAAPMERDPDTFYDMKRIGGKKIYFIEGSPYLDSDGKILYGSTLTMIDAVKNMISWGYEPSIVIKSASSTPAKAHYIDDKKGSIEKGKDADIILIDRINGKNKRTYRLGDVKYTLVKGKVKYISKDFQEVQNSGRKNETV